MFSRLKESKNTILKLFLIIFFTIIAALVSNAQSESRYTEQKLPSGFFYKYGMEYLSYKSKDRAYSDFTRFYPISLGVGYKIANTNFSTISLTIDRTFFGDGYIMPIFLHYDWYPSIYYKGVWGKEIFIGLGLGYLSTDMRTYLNENLGGYVYEGHFGADKSKDTFWELKYSSFYTTHYQYYVDYWTLTYGHNI